MNDAFVEAGYAQGDIPLGTSPAVLAVDFQVGFTEDRLPIGRSTHVGDAVSRAILLLAGARSVGVPVIHTYVDWRSDGIDIGLWTAKVPSLAEFVAGSGLEDVDPRLLRTSDIVIHKRKPSAFFGTGLEAIFRERGIDTLVVCGVTTSGCVRASIVDAFSYGFRTVVASDACGDQDARAHEANLSDVARRYANVWSVSQVLTRIFGRGDQSRVS